MYIKLNFRKDIIMDKYNKLIEKAKSVRKNAYSPYSKYKVGAALLTQSGNIYCGCNVEDVSTRAGSCAERVAIFNAISNGEKNFEKILIIGGNSDDKFDKITPCGTCRQMLFEFCSSDFEVINYYIENGNEKIITHKLSDLLPYNFKL